MKLPALHFYIGDWRKDIGVQSLSYELRGIWFEILCLMHESEQRGKLLLKGKPMTEDQLSRILGLDNQILTTALRSILSAGVADIDQETGAIMSRRMVRDEKLRIVRKECGKLGGNPDLVKQNPTKKKILTYPRCEGEDETESTVPSLVLGDARGETEEEKIYALYPHKVGKPSALRAIKAALKSHTPVFLKEKTAAYAEAVKGTDTHLPNPATWFRDERFNNDPSTWSRRNGKQRVIADHSKGF